MARAGSAALVTGASSGIGAAFARQLARRGHGLILVARRRDRLEQLAGELTRAHGVAAEVLVADLSEDHGVASVESRIATAPDLDLVVNNAGFGSRGRFWDGDDGLQDRMYRVHVLATMRLTRALCEPWCRGTGARSSTSPRWPASPPVPAAPLRRHQGLDERLHRIAGARAGIGRFHVKVQALCRVSPTASFTTSSAPIAAASQEVGG
jgi:NAD(P)-dependent dehydrogenase (short-subunit alcohol dehydrogenase family)